MRGRVGIVVIALVMLSVGAMPSEALADESNKFGQGDCWIYDLDIHMEQILMSGTLQVDYDCTETSEFAGTQYDVYSFSSSGTLMISGSYQGVSCSGSTSLTENYHLEISSLNTVCYEYNMSISMTATFLGLTSQMESWTHNVTTCTPPGGIGYEPESEEIGATWTRTYTLRSEEMECDDDVVTCQNGTYSKTVTYSIIAHEEVTVPAGTFDCIVLQQVDSEGITTAWLSEEVGREVKLEEQTDLGISGTYSLRSYSYTPPSEDTAFGAVVILGVVVAAAVVCVIVAWWILRGMKGGPEVASVPQEQSAQTAQDDNI